MIRPVLTELALFLTPFLVYAIFLWATKAGVLDASQWTLPRIGWLEWLINTPSAHRVHHASNPEYIDKNYGGVLLIWDHLFGSYQAERPDIVRQMIAAMPACRRCGCVTPRRGNGRRAPARVRSWGRGEGRSMPINVT